MDLLEETIRERADSLQKDVRACLEKDAPFPAMLYCFATVDFLGAVAFGNASSHAPTTAQAANYMKQFMGYSEEQVRLLQKQFRHKLVHLAQPAPLVRDVGRLIAWRYWHDNADVHLKLIPFGSAKWHEPWEFAVWFAGMFPVDYEFNLSITHFASEIVSSAIGPQGLIVQMRQNAALQDNVRRAINQILNSTA